MIAHVDPDTETGPARVVPARPVGRRSPDTGTGEDQRRVQRRPAAGRRDDQAELRHPDQPLPRGRLRRLPQHRQRDRHGADLLPDAGARHADRARHPGGRDASASTATMALAYVRSRYYEYFENGKWHEDGPTPTSAASRASSTSSARSRNEAVKSGFRQLHEGQRHPRQDASTTSPATPRSDSPTSSRSRRPSARSIPASSRW